VTGDLRIVIRDTRELAADSQDWLFHFGDRWRRWER